MVHLRLRSFASDGAATFDDVHYRLSVAGQRVGSESQIDATERIEARRQWKRGQTHAVTVEQHAPYGAPFHLAPGGAISAMGSPIGQTRLAMQPVLGGGRCEHED